ncbi:hypothetical protein SERLADRAFT_467980 [Serpula lacrymans var. lacrymans S7.9]|nr:uncharacterized protein SERLADRAFT_467980 [Serpula lacrymans var. lacrymans S7.9]EGO24525.1 hypothetical protein SERLADRAFT_467980 [Serpula lacrymans var. lacrymans S7.9]
MSNVLRHMAQYQSANFEPESLSTLGDALRDTYSSSLPPRTVRWCLEHILVHILKSVHAGKAISVIKAITRTSPSYFKPSFFLRCSHVFLRHKQYRYAVQLLELVGRLYPRYSTMFRCVVHELTRSGATSLVPRACLAVPGSLGKHRYHFTARTVAIRAHMPIRILSLKASSMLDRDPSDISTIRLAMHLLIRAGRILATKKLFARVADKLDADTRTSLCNIYLHGVVIQPLPRNGRKMRKVLASLNYLVDHYSFTPDRVTVNILLKAVMRWRTMFDNKKLRALFDHMIRSGYPAGEHVSSGRLPFGTPLSRAPQEMQLPKLPPYISFERHARPLYMMFIKAFYFRNDVQAARTVIDILKGEKHAVAMRNMEQGPPHDVTDDVHS